MSPTPTVQHAPDLPHARLALPDQVVNRIYTGEHGPAIFQSDPAVCPRLAKVDVQSFVNTDDQGNSQKRILTQLLLARFVFPGMKGRRSNSPQQTTGLGCC